MKNKTQQSANYIHNTTPWCALPLLTLLLFTSCAHKKDPPLIIPPHFAELPDPNKPEKPSQQQQDANIAKLKELLLQSE